jgi:hypothetical protein
MLVRWGAMVRPPGFEPGRLLAPIEGDQKRGRHPPAEKSADPVLDQARLRPQLELRLHGGAV